MKNIIAIIALTFSTLAFSAQKTIDVSNLTPEQISQISKQVDTMNDSPANVSATVRKEAEAWGELGANMGKAMVGAAKEVGIASNEFGQTDLGRIVVAIVAYKIIGQELLSVIIGSLIIVFGYSVSIWILNTRRFSTVKYEHIPVLWGMFTISRVVSSNTIDSVVGTKMFFAGFTVLLSTLIGIVTIF